MPEGVPVLQVAAPRSLLGRFAAHVYGDPARSLRMLGVTGTQGKTTTTRLAESALQRAGVRSAVVGTVGTRVDGEEIKTALTTPEAPDLHGLFAMMKERSVTACAMEVSSHALVQGRVDGVVFDLAVFTNLGRDHLDFHVDLEDYFQAKASLFTPQRCVRGLVNADDEHGRRLLAQADVPLQSFSATGGDADWRAEDVQVTSRGSEFVVTGPEDVRVEAACPLPGDFNVANALAGLAACALLGFDLETVARAMAEGGGVPGRLERVDAGQDFTVVVDYAHKPDAVTAALAALRPLTTGRLIVVLGAGGERDPGKRPIMGEIAARLADVLVVTDDNPRGEEPAAVRAEILAGTRGGSAEVLEVGDRRAAIREAVGRARAGDVVLVAGKGHETGQEVAGVVHPFDDREVVREELGVSHDAVIEPMIPMTLAEIADVVAGEVVGDPSVAVTGPAFRDNREPAEGGLFVAIVGERVDGHDFAEAAVAGRRGRRPRQPADGGADGRGGDVVVALGRLARHVVDVVAPDRAGTHRLAGQDRHQGLPRPGPRRRRRDRGHRRATSTTSWASLSPCCAAPPTPSTSSSRWAPAGSGTSPSCAGSPRPTWPPCSTSAPRTSVSSARARPSPRPRARSSRRSARTARRSSTPVTTWSWRCASARRRGC